MHIIKQSKFKNEAIKLIQENELKLIEIIFKQEIITKPRKMVL